MSKFARREKAPAGFKTVEPVLTALSSESRAKVNESHEGKRKTESLWPVHQINWQRTRYVHDMHYHYKKIDKATCVPRRRSRGASVCGRPAGLTRSPPPPPPPAAATTTACGTS